MFEAILEVVSVLFFFFVIFFPTSVALVSAVWMSDVKYQKYEFWYFYLNLPWLI